MVELHHQLIHGTARLLDPEQTVIERSACLGLLQKRHDLRDCRDCRRGMERYVSPMQSDDILGDVVAPRYVAIR
jgi:hypothetical protein